MNEGATKPTPANTANAAAPKIAYDEDSPVSGNSACPEPLLDPPLLDPFPLLDPPLLLSSSSEDDSSSDSLGVSGSGSTGVGSVGSVVEPPLRNSSACFLASSAFLAASSAAASNSSLDLPEISSTRACCSSVKFSKLG